MAAYLPQAELTALLPTGHGLSSGQLDDCIAAGSADVDSMLAHLYWVPFTAYSADPAASPPWVIREAAWYFSAVHAYHQMENIQLLGDDSGAAKRYWEQARAILEPYKTGEQQIAPDTETTALNSGSWGDGDPYNSNQAVLGITRGEYVEGSARMDPATDWELDRDFGVYYYAPRRAWVFERYDSTIGDNGDDDVVTYEVSRLKKREQMQPRIQTIDLLRG